jgi:hypothetical protein
MKQFFRLVLHSNNKLSGTNYDATFNLSCYNMLPSMHSKMKFQFAVESFATDLSILGDVLAHIPSFTQINSYSTLTKSENQCVMMTGMSTYQRNITHDTIGILITNPDILQNGIMHVIFTESTGAPLTNIGDWSMSILVWECDKQ